jgi:hypothetical protein
VSPDCRGVDVRSVVVAEEGEATQDYTDGVEKLSLNCLSFVNKEENCVVRFGVSF